MTHRLELIARLNTKHQQYQMGRGGTTELTWDAIAAATCGLSRTHLLLLHLLRDGATPDERMEFRCWLNDLVLNKIQDGGKKPRRGLTVDEVATGVTTIALYSYLHAAGQCEFCGGDGLVESLSTKKLEDLAKKLSSDGRLARGSKLEIKNQRMENCRHCRGTGVQSWPYRARLQMAGWLNTTSNVGPVQPKMTEDSYRMSWNEYEHMAFSAIKLLESQAEQWLLWHLGLVDDDDPQAVYID